MNWFLDSKLTFRLTVPVTEPAIRARALEFLKTEGYRDIVDKEGCITAQRGSWRQVLFANDPRRIPHSVRLDGDRIVYQVSSRCLWFGAADGDVFRTEARILAAFLENRVPEGPTMAEVQKFRLKTDVRNIIIMVVLFIAALGVMLGISQYYKKKLRAPMPATDWIQDKGPRLKR